MKINFNNTRKSLGLKFNELSKVLIETNENLSNESIEKFNELGSLIGAILATYDEGNEDFKDMSEEVTIEFIEEIQ